MPDRKVTEIIVALVSGIGANFDQAVKILTEALTTIYGFDVAEIRLSSLFKRVHGYENLDRGHFPRLSEYYPKAIEAGNRIRAGFKDSAALSRLAMNEIQSIRTTRTLNGGSRRAYIINSLKRPEEIAELRQVYGQLFYCVAIYADQATREARLTADFSSSIEASEETAKMRLEAARLVRRDNDENADFGQEVRKTFQDADYFVRTDEAAEFEEALQRFLCLAMDAPYVSPTRSEVAMMHARTAALRSVDLSRQVGATIVNRQGAILSTGCNEVPSPGGGQYWEDDPDDSRDFRRGRDENDRMKERAVLELLNALSTYACLDANKESEGLAAMYKELEGKKAFDDTRIDSLIEFGRIVHAENAAVNSAALTGTAILDGDLYCTTFPCHMCARVLIDAGIRNVFYIEPYPKSAVTELYSDQILINPNLPASLYTSRVKSALRSDRRLYFIPFEGVAPRRYHDLFSNGRRKKAHGIAESFNPKANPRQMPRIPAYLEAEKEIADLAIRQLDELNKSIDAEKSASSSPLPSGIGSSSQTPVD